MLGARKDLDRSANQLGSEGDQRTTHLHLSPAEPRPAGWGGGCNSCKVVYGGGFCMLRRAVRSHAPCTRLTRYQPVRT